jgi:nucleoside-diphosphate-sugar epimerase
MKHVILGAGPVGRSTAAALARRHLDVTLISRTSPAPLPAGVRHLAADVLDRAALARACTGASVIYQCLNAPYHQWRERFPPLQAAAVEAARAVNARYVSFENVYAYGRPGTTPFVETQAFAPCTEKGRVRAEMIHALTQLHVDGALEVIHVRASDLFGPGLFQSGLGDEVLGRAVRGLGVRGLGDLDAPHTWTFTQDAGETMATAGLRGAAAGRVWHVPSDRPRSQREVVREVGTILGRSLPVSATPALVLRLVGLFRPEAGALVEMLYEFDRPFIVGDEATRVGLGVTHTPFAAALLETVQWFSAVRGRAPASVRASAT